MNQPPLDRLPAPLSATLADLPPSVAAVMRDPPAGTRIRVETASLAWSALAWGDLGATPLLLVHGVYASAGGWWLVGPTLAAAGFRVVAPDQAGHGYTRTWLGHHRFADNARDLAEFSRAAGIDRPDLHVVGHSWGAVTVAALPAAGIRPAKLVLLDPPILPLDEVSHAVDDEEAHLGDPPAVLLAWLLETNAAWAEGDVRAKAEALRQVDVDAVRDVLRRNGDWDGGLEGLEHPAARDVPVWLVRGEPACGSLVPDEALPRLVARVGAERLLTISGGPHSPHRSRAAATILAILRALGRTP